MSNPLLPHLPEAVYDVQAEVTPIHRPALIWMLLAPIVVATAVAFGVSFDYYGGITYIETTVGINFERGAGWNCKMLGLGSDRIGLAIESSAADMQMWGADTSALTPQAAPGTVVFTFANLYFENFEQCYAHMDDKLNPLSICNTIASSLSNVAPAPGTGRTQHGCSASSKWIPVAALGAKGIDATSTAAQSISISIDQGINWENAVTTEDGLMNQVAGNAIDADFDCSKSFRDGFCESGVFGEQAKVSICQQTFQNIPPFACSRSVPKYAMSDRLALSWSNCMMLWSIGLSLLVFVLRRLPGKPGRPAVDGITGTVDTLKSRRVV